MVPTVTIRNIGQILCKIQSSGRLPGSESDRRQSGMSLASFTRSDSPVLTNLQCLKYKTKSFIMFNRFEAFNLSMMSKMQNRRPQDVQPSAQGPSKSSGAPGTAVQASSGTQDVMADATASQGAGGGTSSSVNPTGAAKKKKQKKKK